MKPPILAVLLLSVPLPRAAAAQCVPGKTVSVSGSATVAAPADLAILTFALQTAAPLASDAVAANHRLADAVRTEMAPLAAIATLRLGPITLAKAGSGYYQTNLPPTITAIEAHRFAFVLISGPTLHHRRRFADHAAAVVDAMGKAGAIPATSPYGPQQPSNFLVFALTAPSSYVAQARSKAIERARSAARAVAAALRFDLAGVCAANVYTMVGQAGIMGGTLGNISQQANEPLAQLPYRFYSADPENVAVRESVNLTYATRP